MEFYCIFQCDWNDSTLHNACIFWSPKEGKATILWVCFPIRLTPGKSNCCQYRQDHSDSRSPSPHASPSLVAAPALVQLCKLNHFPAEVHPTAKVIPLPAWQRRRVGSWKPESGCMTLPFLGDADWEQVKQTLETWTKSLCGRKVSWQSRQS